MNCENIAELGVTDQTIPISILVNVFKILMRMNLTPVYDQMVKPYQLWGSIWSTINAPDPKMFSSFKTHLLWRNKISTPSLYYDIIYILCLRIITNLCDWERCWRQFQTFEEKKSSTSALLMLTPCSLKDNVHIVLSWYILCYHKHYLMINIIFHDNVYHKIMFMIA